MAAPTKISSSNQNLKNIWLWNQASSTIQFIKSHTDIDKFDDWLSVIYQQYIFEKAPIL